MKKLFQAAFLAAIGTAVLAGVSCKSTPERKEKIAEMKSFENSAEIVAEMEFGWNLGNTLDAFVDGQGGTESETSWGQPKTTAEMFTALKKAGFKTVRIPITWHNHLVGDDYTIDSAWMARVKEVVDMAYGEGLYVIINIHHDTAKSADVAYGQGYYPAESAKDESIKFITRVWEQVSAAFNNSYDEHLIFEVLNEPRLVGHEREWWYDAAHADCRAAQGIIVEYEEACIAKIRESGGNNATRYIMVPAYVAQPWAAMADTYSLPADSAEGKLIVSVHMYDPWSFAGDNPGESVFTDEMRAGQKNTFDALGNAFTANGIGVVIGECGATNKGNLSEREAWFSYYFEQSKRNGLTAILWDNGSVEIPEDGNVSEHYGFFNRTEQTFFFPTLLQCALDGIAAGKAE